MPRASSGLRNAALRDDSRNKIRQKRNLHIAVQVTSVESVTVTRPPRRDSADNREALLSAARLVFNRDPNASLETVATEAGLSRRSVYGHFANRDELLLELVTSGARRIAGALEGISHPDPLIRLALIASRLWREVESIRVMAVIAVRGPLASDTARFLEPIRRNVRAAVRDGQSAGTMRPDVAPERLARLVESTALVVLEEATRHPLGEREGHELVIVMTLGAVGLGWAASQNLIDTTPEISWKDGE